MVLHQIATASVAYGLFKVPRIRRRSCVYILSMLSLLVRTNISSLPSSYGLNLPPAGNLLDLPHGNTPIYPDLTRSHWSGGSHLGGSKGGVLPATERNRAIRLGIPARFAHATAVWCREMERPLG